MEALVVYYSDERNPHWNQKLVLQYTTDGKNWSELIDVVAQIDSICHGIRGRRIER